MFNGLSETFFHAVATEKFLVDKDLSDEKVFSECIVLLKEELTSSGVHETNNPLDTAPDYRISLALSLFYKFILGCNLASSKSVKDEYKSAIDSLIDCRPVSRSEQSYQQKSELFPLTQAVPKLNAYAQTSGETKFVDDLSPLSLQLNGAFILTQVANAKIGSVNTDVASKMPGVVRIFLAKDIPGLNNITPKPLSTELLFAEDEVLYAGKICLQFNF